MLSYFLKQGVIDTTHVILLMSFLVSAATVLATVPGGQAGQAVALAWDASTDPTVTGYNVYYGTESGTYTNVISVGKSNSAIVSNLVIGVTYYFAATTYTVDGLESDYSSEASYAPGAPNHAPTLDPLKDLAITQDSSVQTVLLTGITSGAPNEDQSLNISAFSSNPGLIPSPEVTYSSPDAAGSLTLSPAAGSFGSTIITVMVDDGGAISNTVIRAFTVTVTPVDNPPTIDLLSDVVVDANSGPQTVNLTGITSGSTNGGQTLAVTAVCSDPALIGAPTLSYSSPSTTGTLVFSPITNAVGSAKITVTVNDNQPTNNSTSVTFGITVRSTASVPGLLTNATIGPNTTFRFLINPPATNGDKFNISLGAGAPDGAKITSRRGNSWLVWTPTIAQASTTNLIAIQITDQRDSSLSTNEMLQVIVQDYLALALGSTSVQVGQTGSIPLALSSSEGVTNLSFAMPWPANRIGTPSLSISAAGVASSSLRNQSSNLLVTVQMSAGQVLQGSNVIGSLTFQSQGGQPSGYVNLPISNITGLKPSSAPYVNLVPTAGKVAIINNLAMLQTAAGSGSSRSITILGKVGNTYQLQYCTNYGPAAIWTALGTYNQTNISQSFNVDSSIPQALYRVQQK